MIEYRKNGLKMRNQNWRSFWICFKRIIKNTYDHLSSIIYNHTLKVHQFILFLHPSNYYCKRLFPLFLQHFISSLSIFKSSPSMTTFVPSFTSPLILLYLSIEVSIVLYDDIYWGLSRIFVLKVISFTMVFFII